MMHGQPTLDHLGNHEELVGIGGLTCERRAGGGRWETERGDESLGDKIPGYGRLTVREADGSLRWEDRDADWSWRWEVQEAGRSTGSVALLDVSACVALLQLLHFVLVKTMGLFDMIQ